MLLFKEHAKALCELMNAYNNRRYKVLVLCGVPLIGKTQLAQQVCKTLNGKYIDVTTDLLPLTLKPVLGAYGPNNFINWLESQMRDFNSIICLDEIEPLIVTFGEHKAINLFKMLQGLELRSVALVVTRLESIVSKAEFPLERIHYLKR